MTIQIYLERAQHLLNLGRHAEAINEVKQALGLDPNNATGLLLLTIAYTHGDDPIRAIQAAQTLLGADPNSDLAHYFISVNSLTLNKIGEAEFHIRAAIEANPTDADFFAQYAHVFAYRKDFAMALRKAEEGLALDAENINCLNMRTQALTKLGYKTESTNAAFETLSADPNNAFSHTNIGWSKLENGDTEGAKYHFAEALRLNPSLDEARTGMLECLKSKNIFYRYFLYYGFWLAKKTEKAQWAVLVGVWLGMNVLSRASNTFPLLTPIVYLLIFFVYMTWFTNALFNLMLLADPVARHALNEREKKAAYAVGIGFSVVLINLAVFFMTDDTLFRGIAIVIGMLILPVVKFFESEDEKLRNRVKLFAIGMSVTGLISLLDIPVVSNLMFSAHTIGFVAFQWLYNYWMINRRLF